MSKFGSAVKIQIGVQSIEKFVAFLNQLRKGE